MVFHLPYLAWFKKNGFETYVCARNDYENKEDCLIPYCDKYYDLPFERSPFKLNNIKVYQELKKKIDSNEFDIIHCHTPMGGVLTRLAARGSRYGRTKVIYTAHGFHFYKGAPFLNWMLYYPIERWLARYTDVLITINKEDYTRARMTFKAQNIEHIPGVGINTKDFAQINVSKCEKRKKLGIPEEAFIVLSVGEVNENKNHEIVVRALSKLKYSNIYYVICGQGPLEDQLRNMSKQLGLEKQIKVIGHRNDVDEIYKVSDVFIFPSFREGLSVALMEAMSSGLPVVCSKIRGNTDLIIDGKGGYLVNPENVEGYAKAIERLYKSIELRQAFSEYNIEMVKKYSIHSILREMSRVYLDSLK
jgi:glycosyltransferase involved in cell wall biosynthesis